MWSYAQDMIPFIGDLMEYREEKQNKSIFFVFFQKRINTLLIKGSVTKKKTTT